MTNKKKILIVGGTGFLGFHFAKLSLKKKWIVHSISSKKPKKKRFLKKVKYIICDISKKKQISKIGLNYDYVFNFGGYVDHTNRKKTLDSHYHGCKNLANHFLKSKIKCFIQIGSSTEYGNSKSPQKESFKTSIKKLKSTYAQAKLKSTRYLLQLNKKYNFPATILRLYLVYGPYQDINRFLPIIIEGCLQDKDFDTSNGKQKRDFLFVSDLNELIIKVVKKQNKKAEIFNIGSGKPQTLKDIILQVQKKIKKGKPNFGKVKLRKDEILNLYPNIDKAKKKLNWKPKTSFLSGLNKTIKYYKEQK